MVLLFLSFLGFIFVVEGVYDKFVVVVGVFVFVVY